MGLIFSLRNKQEEFNNISHVQTMTATADLSRIFTREMKPIPVRKRKQLWLFSEIQPVIILQSHVNVRKIISGTQHARLPKNCYNNRIQERFTLFDVKVPLKRVNWESTKISGYRSWILVNDKKKGFHSKVSWPWVSFVKMAYSTYSRDPLLNRGRKPILSTSNCTAN